jgi:hypothetical protein
MSGHDDACEKHSIFVLRWTETSANHQGAGRPAPRRFERRLDLAGALSMLHWTIMSAAGCRPRPTRHGDERVEWEGRYSLVRHTGRDRLVRCAACVNSFLTKGGSVLRELEPVEKQVLDSVWAACKPLYEVQESKGGPWTDEIQRALGNLGRTIGFQVYFNNNPREWLWDLCWVDSGPDMENFRGVNLVCEVEWSRTWRHRLEDFLKLAAADCTYRIFVFEWPSSSGETPFQALISASAALPGKKFLAIGVPPPTEKPDKLSYRAWIA